MYITNEIETAIENLDVEMQHQHHFEAGLLKENNRAGVLKSGCELIREVNNMFIDMGFKKEEIAKELYRLKEVG